MAPFVFSHVDTINEIDDFNMQAKIRGIFTSLQAL